MYVFAHDEVSFNNVIAGDGTHILGSKGVGNITVFFDDGEYIDADSTGYTAFSHENTSYIGLNKDGNGDPSAIISRVPRNDPAVIDGCIERNIFDKPNIYIENLIFDGKNHDMVPVSYKHGKKTKKYRGEYFFHINGTNKKTSDGFVMRDVILRNIGDNDSSNDGSYSWSGNSLRKNVAINVHYNPGKVNIENVKIQNVATANNFGVIQIQDGDATYLKNIAIDMSRVGKNVNPVKVETTTNTNIDKLEQNATIKTLTATNVDSSKDCIYVEDYKYDFIKVPENYRYAVWSSTNGSYISSSFNIYKEKPATAKNNAVMDLKDNYWLVDASSTDVTIEEQLVFIARVMKYTQEDVDYQKSPDAKIKLVGSEIPSFKVPDE